ncbi:MAG: hypothetical protein HYY65_03480 [Candidatus Tectomicrobia bacterium]|uniref:Transmembrane protein n=1 Tax=Tectimicrobiota bacterium TaxID=2528274 RepID=A0A932GNA1_UNCTE|nr:hypothetical protein [Candidatus Tectomicrobia bacterium]
MKSSATFMTTAMSAPFRTREVSVASGVREKENRTFFVVTGILIGTGIFSAVVSVAMLVYGYIQYTSW